MKKSTVFRFSLLAAVCGLLILQSCEKDPVTPPVDNSASVKPYILVNGPSLLSDKPAKNISSKFEILSKRQIQDYENEYKQKDRIEFDEAVLKAYGFKTDILPHLYSLLTETIRNRVEMKNR